MADGAARSVLRIAGVCVLAWGILLVLTLGVTIEGLGSSIVFAGYSALLITGDRRAVALGWLATTLTIIATVSSGLLPVRVVVSSALFGLSMFVTDIRDRLVQSG